MQNKPTGFEDYFADAPLTPTQVLEEGELYSSDQPFNARILTAIQRYGARRKLDSERRDVFYKWLVYGGIRVGPNMFQGSSVRDREVLDKDQIVSSLAQTSLNADKDDLNSPDAKYVVDFEGVMRGFLCVLTCLYAPLPLFWSPFSQDSVKLIFPCTQISPSPTPLWPLVHRSHRQTDIYPPQLSELSPAP